MSRNLLLIAIVAFVGCGSKPAAPSKPPGWSRDDLIGWRYVRPLPAENKVISMVFWEEQANQTVFPLQEDMDRSPDLPPEAPQMAGAWDWTIEANGELTFRPWGYPTSEVWFRWKLIFLDETSAKILYNDEPVTLQRERTGR